MLWKARKPKNASCKTILERWNGNEQYRKSLSDIGWNEEQIKQYDALALEDHSCVSTPEERSRYQNYWAISLNREGIRRPLDRRPDLLKQGRNAEDCTMNTLNELVKETDRSILHSKTDSDVTNNSRASMGPLTVDPRTGWKIYPSTSRKNHSAKIRKKSKISKKILVENFFFQKKI